MSDVRGQETQGSAVGLGWRIHSSSAVVVGVRGPLSAPVVIHRDQVSLIGDTAPREPYHAAVGLALDQATALISSLEEIAAAAAASILQGYVESLGGVACVGLVGGDRPVRAPLERVLTKHALLHASERDLFEQAVKAGAARVGLAVTTIPAKGKATIDHASAVLGTDLSPALAAAGRSAGKPWQKDHREAAAAALVALDALSRAG